MRRYFLCPYNPVRPHERPGARIITPFLSYLRPPVSPEHAQPLRNRSVTHCTVQLADMSVISGARPEKHGDKGTVFAASLPCAPDTFHKTPPLIPAVTLCHIPVCQMGTLKLTRSKVTCPRLRVFEGGEKVLEPGLGRLDGFTLSPLPLCCLLHSLCLKH